MRAGGCVAGCLVQVDPGRDTQDPFAEAASERREDMPRDQAAPRLPRGRRLRTPGGGCQGRFRPEGVQQGTELVQGPRWAAEPDAQGAEGVGSEQGGREGGE